MEFKFSEGERVLCFEPDPTKARVLYDAKVSVPHSKDYLSRILAGHQSPILLVFILICSFCRCWR